MTEQICIEVIASKYGVFEVYVNGEWKFTKSSWHNVTAEIDILLNRWRESLHD